MLLELTEPQAAGVAAAMLEVASARRAEPLSRADREGIVSAWSKVCAQAGSIDLDVLDPITPSALAAAVPGVRERTIVVEMLAVMAFVDADIDDAKLETVLDYAAALGVDADFVHSMRALLENNIKWAALDMIHHNVATIPGMPWEPNTPFAPFLPYQGANADPALVARYETLAQLPPESFGRAFYEHYRHNGFAFPGAEDARAERWATPHDSLHVLSGYSTSAQGELLVAAFTGAMLRNGPDMMESHVLPVILIYHMGITINRGLNKGDDERVALDPSWWRDNFVGDVHLGLDPAKLWVAWDRGRAMTENVYRPDWSFWDVTTVPLDELRANYGVPALPPEDAAAADTEIDRSAYVRPGRRLPELGVAPILDH
ncbi:MAG TPA: hypothetical protein VF183_12690 [Acidimicrobiales bacterium]